MKSILTTILFGIFAVVSPASAQETKAAPKDIIDPILPYMTLHPQETKAAPKDIIDTAVAAGSFKTLTALLGAAGLVETLKGTGPFTLFAPTDEAFARIGKAALEDLLKPENKEKLVTMLSGHVSTDKTMLSTAEFPIIATTLDKKKMNVGGAQNHLNIGMGSAVVNMDIECSNGVIHVLSGVIWPWTRPGLSQEWLDEYDDKAPTKDIFDTAVAAGSFKTLTAALSAAGLDETMKGSGPFTLFAPTDEAFAKLPKGTVDDLLKPENKEKLVAILTNHVVAGTVMLFYNLPPIKATALNKQEIRVDRAYNYLALNKTARLITLDIECTNGVIHIIDTVNLPVGSAPN
jgi:transforming growth factor-beta-induced protein